MNLNEDLDIDLKDLDVSDFPNLNNLKLDSDSKPISKIYGDRYQLFLKRYPFMKFFDQKNIKSNLDYFLYGDLLFIESSFQNNSNEISNYLNNVNGNSFLFFWMYIYIYSQLQNIKKDPKIIDRLNTLLEEFNYIIKDRTVDILWVLINY